MGGWGEVSGLTDVIYGALGPHNVCVLFINKEIKVIINAA